MKKALWIRLRKYRFENLVPPSLIDKVKAAFGETDAYTRAFAAKIARKHNWSDEFAFLAIREYKKFVYLGTVSHYDVTPSTVIDIVWHEHQLFTSGYREFCRDVIGRHFDHSPELIPFDQQTEVFSAQYEKTLAFYKHEFGVEPPPEIWGRPKFDPKKVVGTMEKPEKKRRDSAEASDDGSTPLFQLFTSSDDRVYAPIPVHFSSGGGGNFGGGGASGTSCGTKTDATVTTVTTEAAATSCSSSSVSSCSSGSSCGGGGGD